MYSRLNLNLIDIFTKLNILVRFLALIPSLGFFSIFKKKLRDIFLDSNLIKYLPDLCLIEYDKTGYENRL
jgi:hypothetical protein